MRYLHALCSALLIVLLLAPGARAQNTGTTADRPEADPADVATVDAIITAVYDVISGPAGPRDWDRFKSLFTDDARLIPVGQGQDGTIGHQSWSPQDYVERGTQMFSQTGFFETELARKEERFRHIVHAFSTYESRRNADDAEPFTRGINSFQLMHDGSRWWIVTIFWNAETPDYPIPEEYLSSK
jgi:hypothetical protein